MREKNNKASIGNKSTLINESLIKDIIKYKPIKYVAIGGVVVASIFLLGKTLNVIATSVRGYNNLKSAIKGN